ncbi:MAG: MraY family glycosyltransferase [Parcubacteria group bacterium]|jgi:UDP-GlcNAc:undecaprenyl-phosphate GlcNAc-1-phosphate transferase
MTKFLLPFAYSLAAATVAIYFLLWLGKGLDRRIVRRFGGPFVIAVFSILVLLNKDLVVTKPIAGILAGGFLILIFGLWDDVKNLSWKWQLLFQVVIAAVAVLFGVRSEYIANPFGGVIGLSNPLIFFILFTLYFLLFMNSLNWFDGIDGLSGSLTVVSLVIIFFLSLMPHVNQPAVAILCSIAAGSIFGFLIFNWHPAKIIAGTSGAWFFGFLLAGLSIFAGAKIATVMMVAFIPVLDLIRVIIERWKAGRSVFSRDDCHLHYWLRKKRLGDNHIALIISAASLLIGILALNLKAEGKLVTIILIGVIYLTYFELWPKKQV